MCNNVQKLCIYNNLSTIFAKSFTRHMGSLRRHELRLGSLKTTTWTKSCVRLYLCENDRGTPTLEVSAHQNHYIESSSSRTIYVKNKRIVCQAFKSSAEECAVWRRISEISQSAQDPSWMRSEPTTRKITTHLAFRAVRGSTKWNSNPQKG